MPMALELAREGWKPYLEAARRRMSPPEPTPAERRERAHLLACVREAAEALKARFDVRRVLLAFADFLEALAQAKMQGG